MDGSGWSKPVDILFSPEGQQSTASEPAVVATPDGRVHLVWTGGWDGRIYYSSAWAGETDSAAAWSKPLALNAGGEGGAALDIALDPEGRLHVVYAVILQPEQGIYHVASEDGGCTWECPQA